MIFDTMQSHERQQWRHQRKAATQLMDHIDQKVPEITIAETSRNIFIGATALYRCSRLLRAIDSAVEHGLGDTTGGTVRTLYETWIFGHLIMLGNDNDIRAMWAQARSQGDKILRMNSDSPITYPEAMPEATYGVSTYQQAVDLRDKLRTDDPAYADLPVACYDRIYRDESHFGTHASANVLAQYIQPIGPDDAMVGLNGQDQGNEHRTRIGAYLTSYFASRVFEKAYIDTSTLDGITSGLRIP
jgi:hypothetical protein